MLCETIIAIIRDEVGRVWQPLCPVHFAQISAHFKIGGHLSSFHITNLRRERPPGTAPGGRLPARPHRIAVGPIHFNEKLTIRPSAGLRSGTKVRSQRSALIGRAEASPASAETSNRT